MGGCETLDPPTMVSTPAGYRSSVNNYKSKEYKIVLKPATGVLDTELVLLEEALAVRVVINCNPLSSAVADCPVTTVCT
jgi:hypothetical protein